MRPWLGPSGELLLDEYHERLWQHAVVVHRLGHRRGLHSAHDGVHVGNVHEHRNAGSILWVHEGTDVRDAERAEHLFALGRGEPVLGVLDVVMVDDGGHTFPWLRRPGGSAR